MGRRTACPMCSRTFIWTDCRHEEDDFVIYDLETTGMYPESDEFIQIAAIRMRAGRLCEEDTFFSYARPRTTISWFIQNYTGISNRDVKNAPPPEEVLTQFSKWAGGATLMAHNAARFDSKFLAATCNRHGLMARKVPSIDSIRLSKMLFGSTRGTGHSLDIVVQRLGIAPTTLRRHDARGDVDLLGRAVCALQQKLELDLPLNGVPRHTTLLPAI